MAESARKPPPAGAVAAKAAQAAVRNGAKLKKGGFTLPKLPKLPDLPWRKIGVGAAFLGTAALTYFVILPALSSRVEASKSEQARIEQTRAAESRELLDARREASDMRAILTTGRGVDASKSRPAPLDPSYCPPTGSAVPHLVVTASPGGKSYDVTWCDGQSAWITTIPAAPVATRR